MNASLGEVRLAWQQIGPDHGHPVLVVHGFGSNRRANWLDAGWEQPLADAGLRGILVDLRGHGDSDKPSGSENYRTESFVGDLVAFLDQLELPHASYLGYSYGARLGWELASASPHRLDRLVLGGFSARDPLSSFDFEAARAFVTAGIPIADPVTADLLRMASFVPGNDLERILQIAEGIHASGSPRSLDQVPHIPTLFVAGERDEIAHDSEAFAESMGAAHITLPHRTHTSALTARAFKAAAIEFLARPTSS